MPNDHGLGILSARIPDVAVAQAAHLTRLRNDWIGDLADLRDPDAPRAPIVLSVREPYVHADSGIGVLKLFHASRMDPLRKDPFGLVEFGAAEWVDHEEAGGEYDTVEVPHDAASIGVWFLPAVPHRVHICRFSPVTVLGGEGAFTFVVRSSSGAEQNFNFSFPDGSSIQVLDIVVSVSVGDSAWQHLNLSLNGPFPWTFQRCEVSKTTMPS